MRKKVAKIPVQKTWIKDKWNVQLFGDESETWWISFNTGDHTIPAFKADDGSVETALVKNGKYYILNGDFRKEYEEIIDKGFSACKKFFDSKPELHSSWSN